MVRAHREDSLVDRNPEQIVLPDRLKSPTDWTPWWTWLIARLDSIKYRNFCQTWLPCRSNPWHRGLPSRCELPARLDILILDSRVAWTSDWTLLQTGLPDWLDSMDWIPLKDWTLWKNNLPEKLWRIWSSGEWKHNLFWLTILKKTTDPVLIKNCLVVYLGSGLTTKI